MRASIAVGNATSLPGLLACLALSISSPALAFQMPVVQLTENDTVDRDAQIAGDRIAWRSASGIAISDGATTEFVTDLGGTVVEFELSETHLAWVSCPFFDAVFRTCWVDPASLFLHDGETTSVLSDDVSWNTGFDLDGGRVVWSAGGRIYSHEDGVTTPLTEAPGAGEPQASSPVVHGDRVAWIRGDTIHLYDGAQTLPIFTGEHALAWWSLDLGISAERVVWRYAPAGEAGPDFEIFFHDGQQVVNASDDDVDDYDPSVSGTNIAWWSGESGDTEIWLHDGTHARAITDNDYYDVHPIVDGDRILWSAQPDGGQADRELFYFDGTTSRRLTWDDHDQIITDHSHSEGRVVWTACQGSRWTPSCTLPIQPYSPVPELEVFLAPEPGLAGTLAGLAALVALRRRRDQCVSGGATPRAIHPV